MVEGIHSSVADVLSGVPQGTVLGPVLFLIYLRDIEEVVEGSLILSFADDTRLLKEVRISENQDRLQDNLRNIYQWANRNKMVLNADKFSLMTYEEEHSDDIVQMSYRAPGEKWIAKESTVIDI